LGWPAGEAKGRGGCGAPRVILTTELASYLTALRYRPEKIDLPISPVSVKRLRRKLGFDMKKDRADWWRCHTSELASLPSREFAERYMMSLRTVEAAKAYWLPPSDDLN